jgi:serine/threonine protein kinase
MDEGRVSEKAVGPASRKRSERDLILGAVDQADRVPSTVAGWTTSGVRPAPDLPSDYFDGYDVQREIHRGGQGVVYKAHQRNTGRRVAIKVLHGGASAGASGRARFDREVQILGQLQHPGIVGIHDSGTTSDGGLFYVMEYISGPTLDEYVRELRPVVTSSAIARTRSSTSEASLRDRLELFAKICDAVNAAHLKGVIHRDLKPANVRMTAGGEPVVVDFGLAKVLVDSVMPDAPTSTPLMTQTGQFVGSLPWASPEQAEGSSLAIDVRTDVYSLGVILYQLLTGGKFPYRVVGTMREVMDAVLHAEPAKPSTAAGWRIGDELETIVLKALTKERERRYQSAGELARDIRHYLAGEPIEAKRDSGWYVLSKTVRRHRTVVGFAAAMLAMVLVFSVAMTLAWADQAEARRQAVVERDRAERNFDAVRALANTFMFDFYDEIEHLRGATNAREMLVVDAQRYLEKLSEQADERGTDDPELIAEIASAYDRLGDIQASSFRANTGETDAAETSYDRARRLRGALLLADPEDHALLLADAEGELRLASISRRRRAIDPAMDRADAATKAFERYRAAGGLAAVADAGAARASMLRADLDRLRADSAAAIDEARRRVLAAVNRYIEAQRVWNGLGLDSGENSLRQRAVCEDKQALAWLSLGRRLVGGLDGTPEENAVSDLRTEAEAAFAAAEASAQTALRWFDALHEADPAEARVARDRWVAVHNLGLARAGRAALLRRIGDEAAVREQDERALASYERALDIATELALDLSDLEAQRDVGLVMNKVANQARELGDLDKAQRLYDRLVEHRTGVYSADPIARHGRDLAVAYYKQGEVAQLMAEAAEQDAARVPLRRAARQGYTSALRLFRELAAQGATLSAEITETEARIEALDATFSP